LRASSILFDNCSFTSVTGASNFIEFERITFSASSEIYTIYTGSSAQERFTGLPIIHIGSVQFPGNFTYSLTMSDVGDGDKPFDRSVLFDSMSARGFGISVPSLGNYNIRYNSTDGFSEGCLVHDGLSTFEVSAENDIFYESARGANQTMECYHGRTSTFTSKYFGCWAHPRQFVRFSFFLFLPCI
jgi:hypothetical protein